MPKTLAAVPSPNILNPSLVALKPRQVLLLRSEMMGKKEASEEESITLNLKPDQKVLLLRSVARYLDRNGFSKSLKKLLSEAEIEKKDLESTLPDLEEIFCDFLKKRDHDAEDLSKVKTEGIQINGKPKKDAEESVAAEEANDKKKQKKKKVEENAYDSISSAEASKEILEDNVSNDLEKERKDKRKKKKESKSEVSDEKLKDGSSKNKKVTDVEKGDKAEDGDSSAAAEASKKTLEENLSNDFEKERKDKKKKKKKEAKSEVSDEKVKDGSSKNKKETDVVKEDKTNDLVSITAAEALKETLEENEFNHLEKKKKDKKKKKEEVPKSDVTEEKLRDGSLEENKEDTNVKTEDKLKDKKNKSKSKASEAETLKDGHKTKVEDEVETDSKKRKRPETEEENEETLDNKEEESKRRKKDDNENNNNVLKTPVKQPDVEENGNMEKTGVKSAKQKLGKMQLNGSKEPKKPFQRVNVEEVEFVDEKLRDNSYWAKDGADSGYGAKAQEVLGQVRGRDFRHEKTKKKRGSYRGGMIDLQSHSVKFAYSDEE